MTFCPHEELQICHAPHAHSFNLQSHHGSAIRSVTALVGAFCADFGSLQWAALNEIDFHACPDCQWTVLLFIESVGCCLIRNLRSPKSQPGRLPASIAPTHRLSPRRFRRPACRIYRAFQFLSWLFYLGCPIPISSRSVFHLRTSPDLKWATFLFKASAIVGCEGLASNHPSTDKAGRNLFDKSIPLSSPLLRYDEA